MSAAPETGSGTRPRVVFVDDDTTIRRLAEMALEDLPIELIACDGAAAARQALREGPAVLLITDLMMPGESGFDLLASLVAEPALRAGARLVVFSAGLNADNRARLVGLDVWRELSKPVSLQTLEDCVRDALGALPAATASASAAPLATSVWTAAEQQALADKFGGDERLFADFRAQVHRQWAEDRAEGERLCAAADGPGLQRLAHSLKAVLDLLGDAAGAAVARELEAAAAAGDVARCQAGWPQLALHLQPAAAVTAASARPGPGAGPPGSPAPSDAG